MTESSHRIISLIPSATEIIGFLGFGDSLVGRSHECDFPAGVETLPALTRPRFNPAGTSREIDDRVKDVLREALSVYLVDQALLSDLKPTHIVTQAQCEVCAVSLKDVEQAVEACGITDARVISLEPMTLDDVFTDIGRVAVALGMADGGAAKIDGLKARMEAITERAADIPTKPTVATIEWIDPLMVAGNWVPELIERAGGRDLFGIAGVHSSFIHWDSIWSHDPDRIILMPCGFDIERTLSDIQPLLNQPGWDSLRAVRTGQVYVTDGNQFFNRPGPRIIESLEILAEILHPDLFNFGHQGTGWIPFSHQLLAVSR